MKTLVLLAALAVPAAAAPAPQTDLLVTVNGVPVRRSAVADQAFRQYGTAVLNQLVDDILVRQASESLKVKADDKEVEARLKRIQGQFKDEATFKERLAATGQSLENLRAQISEQVMREQLVIKAKQITVTDAEAKDFFEANKEKLATAEAIRLRHILVASEKEANDFLIAVRAGADFARLASQVSTDAGTKDKGGDLGFISKGMLQPDLEKVVFSLKPGEAGGPVRSAVGFHLFKAEELRAPKPAVFKDVQKDLKAALVADRIGKAWPDYLKELRDKAKIQPAQAAP